MKRRTKLTICERFSKVRTVSGLANMSMYRLR